MTIRTKTLWAAMTAAALVAGANSSTAAQTSGSITTTATTTTSTTPTTTGATSSSDAPSVPSGQAIVANRIAAPFATMAGSPENAVVLANALRTGTSANLTYTTTSVGGETAQTTTEITVPTRPMGWGNVSHALALAQFSLNQAGIANPTSADLQAALDGGTVTAADGTSVTLTGVLQQRASGMGWGQIAKTYGTTMGAVNRGVKAQTIAATSAASTPTTTTTLKGAAAASTTASSASSRGLTTASASTANGQAANHGGKGLTTASGAAGGGSSGLVTAAGGGRSPQGHAYGRGLVTAAGGAASTAAIAPRGGASGVVTGNGAAATSIANAGSGNGNGGGNGDKSNHGKGKGGV